MEADTLRILYFLAFMGPWVAAGLAQIIPIPADYDGAIREAKRPFIFATLRRIVRASRWPPEGCVIRSVSSSRPEMTRCLSRAPAVLVSISVRRHGNDNGADHAAVLVDHVSIPASTKPSGTRPTVRSVADEDAVPSMLARDDTGSESADSGWIVVSSTR
jgi:hypothetical protein